MSNSASNTPREIEQRKFTLGSVHLVRAVASLLVCLFHLALGNNALLAKESSVRNFFAFGFVGVEVFFVLSGFIICYSFPEHFGRQHYKSFLLKRIIRIEPPYIASIIIVIVLNLMSAYTRNTFYDINYFHLAGHLGYLNSFDTNTYINVVYWTLGIEFQFYLLIMVLFPLLVRTNLVLAAILFVFSIVALIPMPEGTAFIIPYLSYFGLGILVYFFRYRCTLGGAQASLLAGVLCLQLFTAHSGPGAIAAILTAAVLCFNFKVNRIVQFFSMISFSLYLIHVPVGGKVINLGLRFVNDEWQRLGLVAFALLVSVLFSYCFFQLVERPSLKFAKKILYKKEVKSLFTIETSQTSY